MQSNHLVFPNFEGMVQRHEKEVFLGQRGHCFWFTGLSGSGKSAVAYKVEKELYRLGCYTMLLDGDNVRTGINNNLGFSESDRTENIRRIAEIAKLFVNAGAVVLCSFVSPMAHMRRMAREIIGFNDFSEVFVDTPLEICEQRDVKGLYAKARKGQILDFTGISAPYEAPAAPEIHLTHHANCEIEQAPIVVKYILTKIKS